MMNRILSVTIVFVLASGCKESADLSGYWISSDDNPYPVLVHFTTDQYSQSPNIYGDTVNYQIISDRIMFSNGFERKFYLQSEQLFLLDNETDSILGTFERMKESWFIDHLLVKLAINLNLPEAEGMLVTSNVNSNSNLLYMYSDSANRTSVILNGNQLELGSLLYLSFLGIKDEPIQSLGEFMFLIIDKNITIHKVKLLKNELRKAMMARVIYVTKNNDGGGSIYGIPRKLIPLTEKGISQLPDSIQYLFPPAPPEFNPDPQFLNDHTIICEVLKDSLLVNGKYHDLNSYQQILTDHILQDEKFILVVYVDEAATYNTYINYLHSTTMTYNRIRNYYALEKYGVTYNEGDRLTRKEVRNKYSMRISEISYNDLSKYKSNAL